MFIISIWITFAIFFGIYVTKMFNLWLVLIAWTTGLSIYLLIKNKLPSEKYIILSITLAAIASAAYLGYAFKFYLQIPITFVNCLLASLAVFSVMEKYGEYDLIKTDKKSSTLISVLIGIAVGVGLGLINLLLAKGSSMKVDFAITLPRIIVSLNPGINEEISSRAIFMAFFVYKFTAQNKAPTKIQRFSMWFMMTVPHCYAHGYPFFDSLILLVLFGLPFAFLQRKRDLTSAMLSHALVDLIRFVVVGLPV